MFNGEKSSENIVLLGLTDTDAARDKDERVLPFLHTLVDTLIPSNGVMQ